VWALRLDGVQDARRQQIGQLDGPLVRGSGVAGGPDDQDRRRAVGRADGDRVDRVGRADAAGARSEELGEVDRRLRSQLRLHPDLGGGWPARVVGAVDRESGDLTVVVGAIGLAPQIDVGQHLQQRTVLLGVGQVHGISQYRPELRAVESGGDAQLQFAWGEHAVAVIGREAAGFGDLGDQACVDVERRSELGESAVGIRIAAGREALERGVEPGTLLEPEQREVVGRLHRPVEHQCPHPIREQLGIRGAESGAVREADVAQLVVAERRAQRVEVARCVVGADVGLECQRFGRARVGPGEGVGDQRLPAVVVAGGQQRDIVVEVDLAVDRRARPDPARVERHQVEPIGERGWHH
jgi:hypothetical protein